MSTPLLEVEGLDLYYGDAQALNGVSLELEAGEIVAIVGANGAGKSSLIRAIHGIEKPAHAGRRHTTNPGFELPAQYPLLVDGARRDRRQIGLPSDARRPEIRQRHPVRP